MNEKDKYKDSSVEHTPTDVKHEVGVHHALIIVLGCLALAFVLFCELGHFPGLHGDEAWFGLAAQDVIKTGLHSVSGMTWYTGNLYPLTVAGAFALFGDGVFELRAPGAAANVAAFLILALTLARTFGFCSAWFYLCLSGASLYSIWQSRIAWEVTAFTLPLLALILISVLPYRNSRAPTTALRPLLPDLVVLSLFWIGALSHIIFLMATIAFAGAALGAAMLHPDRRRAEFVVLMACTLSIAPLLLIRKTSIVQILPSWPLSLLLVLAPPAIGGLLFAWVRGSAIPIVQRLCAIAQGWAERELGLKARLWLLALLLGPFVIIHGHTFTMAMSGLASAERMASITPDIMTRVIVIGLGVGLISLLVAGMALGWQRTDGQDDSLKFLILATALCFILLPAFAQRTSLRYYAVPQALLLISGAAAWGSLLPRCPRSLLAALTLAPAVVCGFALNEQLRLQPRPPIHFRLGRMRETSEHFLPQAPLVAALRTSSRCVLDRSSFFIEKPVQFLYNTSPWPCDPSMVCHALYCLDTLGSCSPESGYFNVVCSRAPLPSSSP